MRSRPLRFSPAPWQLTALDAVAGAGGVTLATLLRFIDEGSVPSTYVQRLMPWVLLAAVLQIGAGELMNRLRKPGSVLARRPVAPFLVATLAALLVVLVVNDLVTAALLLGQFAFLKSRALLVLASGYLFTAFIAAAHALTFPGLFAPTGLLGGGPQSTACVAHTYASGRAPCCVSASSALAIVPPVDTMRSIKIGIRSSTSPTTWTVCFASGAARR